MQLFLEHHVYKQLGCHVAVTRALCRNISSQVGLELAFGHGSSSNRNSLVSGVIKQLNDTDLPCNVPRVGKNGGGKSFNHTVLINTTITSFACLPIMHVLLSMRQFCNKCPPQVWLPNINFV